MKHIKQYISYIIFFGLLALGYFFILCGCKYNGDNYFMLAGAKEVLKNGFFQKEVLSMHSAFDSVMTQWLFSVIIYLLKTYIGDTFVYYFCVAVFLYIGFILCRISMVINKNNRLFPAVIPFALLCAFFFQIRPYVVTVALDLTEIYLLERYLKEGNRKPLFWLILVSILQINFHNALWITLTLINLCYIVDLAHRTDKKPLKDVLAFSGLVILAGLVNPYGIKYITYIFTSLHSLQPFADLIEETRPPFGMSVSSVTFYIVVALTILFSVIISVKKRIFIPIRMKLLFFGYLVLAFMAKRNLILLYSDGLLGLIFLFDCLPELLPKKAIAYSAGILTFIFLATAIICIRMDETSVDSRQKAINEAGAAFEELVPNKDVRVFDDFNSGSYLEYLGYHPYIDARAEVYGIANNHVRDVAMEYRNITLNYSAGEIKNDLDEYQFEYCFSSRKDLTEKIEALGYPKIYDNDTVTIFDLK